jgi:hypothetical protein
VLTGAFWTQTHVTSSGGSTYVRIPAPTPLSYKRDTLPPSRTPRPSPRAPAERTAQLQGEPREDDPDHLQRAHLRRRDPGRALAAPRRALWRRCSSLPHAPATSRVMMQSSRGIVSGACARARPCCSPTDLCCSAVSHRSSPQLDRRVRARLVRQRGALGRTCSRGSRSGAQREHHDGT